MSVDKVSRRGTVVTQQSFREEWRQRPFWGKLFSLSFLVLVVSAVVDAVRLLIAGRDLGLFVQDALPWVAACLGVTLYLLPSIEAEEKHRRNRKAIFILNLFLGWTLLGWVIALVWANIEDGPRS